LPVHDLYASACEAQFARMAAVVAASSVTPAAVHFSWVAAQLK
jgi:hypothetical protein